MLVRSASVAPKMNLRNPLHADEEVRNQRIHPSFESQDRCHQKSKTKASHNMGHKRVSKIEVSVVLQGYKLTHIAFKVHTVGLSMIPHRTVHEVHKEPPHSTATHMAKP